MSVSALGLFAFLVVSGGNFPGDLVTLIDADMYFQARKVDVTAAQMVALAGKDPVDGKTQIAQLLALRWLGDHPNVVKADSKIRALLEVVAQGKKAQDPQRFARDYAQRALSRVDGKPPPA